MNKQLITTYFEEFKHWLNGGKILSKYTLLAEWSDTQSEDIWRVPDGGRSKALIVIDDEYVEFRKALAEGKTIQCNAKEGENDITYTAYGDTWWVDTTEFKYATRFYRVKPEEPKFKVGDWVVHNGVVKQVTKAVDGLIDSLDNQVAVIMKEESLEPWKPKQGEWCIVYDSREDSNPQTIIVQRWNSKYKWKPLPFTGKLPPYIMDKNKKN